MPVGYWHGEARRACFKAGRDASCVGVPIRGEVYLWGSLRLALSCPLPGGIVPSAHRRRRRLGGIRWSLDVRV